MDELPGDATAAWLAGDARDWEHDDPLRKAGDCGTYQAIGRGEAASRRRGRMAVIHKAAGLPR